MLGLTIEYTSSTLVLSAANEIKDKDGVILEYIEIELSTSG
jgi:hypothetical protein